MGKLKNEHHDEIVAGPEPEGPNYDPEEAEMSKEDIEDYDDHLDRKEPEPPTGPERLRQYNLSANDAVEWAGDRVFQLLTHTVRCTDLKDSGARDFHRTQMRRLMGEIRTLLEVAEEKVRKND